jgi:hypothetical protein
MKLPAGLPRLSSFAAYLSSGDMKICGCARPKIILLIEGLRSVLYSVFALGVIMRIHLVLACLGAATLSLSACAEPVVVSPTAAANSTVLVEANANPAYKPAPGEVQDIKGAFRLEDGRTLTLSNNRNKVFAELDGKREELLPVAENRFIGRDSGTGVAISRVPFADEVVVTPSR